MTQQFQSQLHNVEKYFYIQQVIGRRLFMAPLFVIKNGKHSKPTLTGKLKNYGTYI